MSASADIRAGAAYVELSVHNSALVRGLNAARKRLNGFAASVTAVGKRMALVTGVLATPFLAGVKVYADFEQQMANVSTMLTEPAKHMPGFRESIRDLSIELGESTGTLAKGLYDILSASIPAEQALDVLAVSARAAKAGLTDTGVAADAITTILNAYGLGAERAGDVSDWLFGVVKRGKCVTGDTRVLLADGQYRRIDSLRGHVDVVAWDGRNFTPATAAWCDMGTKRIVRLRTSFGREIRTTPEHPYLTPDGWRPVEQLRQGDRIALPVTLPFFGNTHAPQGWPTLLGYLISEGSIQNSSPRVATTLPVVVAELESAAAALGCEVRPVKRTAGRTESYDIVAGRRGHSGGNPVIDKLRECGLWGENCYGKFIPEECFTWRKEDLADLLRALFTGDGWLSRRTKGGCFQLGYCSVSRRLVEDIAHLLLRFGIVTRVSPTSVNAWILETRRYADIRRFVDFIGIERESAALFDEYEPAPVAARLKGLSSYGKPPRPNHKYYRRHHGVRDFPQPIFFDRITAIEDLPEERVYDLTVPVLHNFVANDIVAHNTTFAELAPSIGMVATIASTAGVSLDEMGAALATMTRNGVKTDNAVTALNAIISSFLKPTSEATEYARSLGFAMSSATLQSEGLAGVFARIGQLPPDAIAKLFPNVRALRGVLPALRNMQGFRDDLAAMGTRAGATGEAYAKMTGTLTHSLAQLKQAGLLVLSVIGEALAEPVSKAAKAITRYARMMGELIRNNKGLVFAAVKIVAAVGAVGGILVAAGSAAAVLAFALGGLASVATTVGSAIGLIGSLLGALLAPVGLVCAAVAALGSALVVTSGAGGRALAWLGECFAWLSETARAAFKGIGDALVAGNIELAAHILWLSLKLAFQKGVDSLMGVWLEFKNGILNAWITLKTGLIKTWQTLWFALKEVVIKTGIAQPLLEGFHVIESGWLRVTQAMGRMWLELVGLIFKAWNRVQSGIKSAQQWIGGIAIDVMGYFDESLDTDAAKQLLRDEFAAEQHGLDAEMAAMQDQLAADQRGLQARHDTETAALSDRQTGRLQGLERQEALGNQGRLAGMRQARRDVDAAAEAERSALNERAAASLEASARALADARAEWKAAIAEAARERTAAGDKGNTDGGQGRIESLIDKVRAAAPAVAGAAGRIEVQGAFDLAGLRALAAAGASDAVAANTAEMVRQQKQTNRKLDEQAAAGLAFL